MLKRAVALTFLLAAAPLSAASHDLAGILYASHLAATIGSVPQNATLPSSASDLPTETATGDISVALSPGVLQFLHAKSHLGVDTIEQVVETSLSWSGGKSFEICFDGSDVGGVTVRHRIRSAIKKQWPIESLTNGQLKFGKSFSDDTAPPICPVDEGLASLSYDVRVGFSHGNWAMIGTDGKFPFTGMNVSLDRFDTVPPAEPDFSRLVAHEFGHVLGLLHEMQASDIPDCSWNKKGVEQYMGWDDGDYNSNMVPINATLAKDITRYRTLPYDPRSIMMYSFPPEAFSEAKSPCATPKNFFPDANDYKIVTAQYTSQPQARAQLNRVDSLLPQLSAFPSLRSALEFKATGLHKMSGE